jgi:nicotinate-nucleotide pyrophosphorylase (carboxylating)
MSKDFSAAIDWNSSAIERLIGAALEEDAGPGDVSALACIPSAATAQARILARQKLVCAGLPLAAEVFHSVDSAVQIEFCAADGETVEPGSVLLRLSGPARAILTGERTALNFLSHLSGIATLTHRFVEQLRGTKARIRDTRKTIPGLRILEKYAVRMGGGANHRMGLYDAILLKENHIAVAGGVCQALAQAHAFASLHARPREMSAYEATTPQRPSGDVPPLPVQIEVRNERELREALECGAESVLLDNMAPAEARRAVALARSVRPACVMEISGGITLANAAEYAATGADFLSSGALTHSAPAADVSLLVDSIEDK